MKLYIQSHAVLALFVLYSLLLLTYSKLGVGASSATHIFGHRSLLNLSGDSEPSATATSGAGQRRLLNLSGSSETLTTHGRRRLLDLSLKTEPPTTGSAKLWQRRLLNLSGSSEPDSIDTTGHRRRLLNLSGSSEPASTDTVGHRRRLLNLSGDSVSSEGGQRRLLSRRIELTEAAPVLHVGEGCELIGYFRAEGFQEYLYTRRESWTLVNSTAELFRHGEKVGVHYFLPEPDVHGGQATWETTSPSSIVTVTSVTKLTVSPSAIPWLLMQTTSSSGSLSRFGGVKYVQRLFSNDGLPPDPTYPGQIGEIYRSSYTATYAFYVGSQKELLQERAQHSLS